MKRMAWFLVATMTAAWVMAVPVVPNSPETWTGVGNDADWDTLNAEADLDNTGGEYLEITFSGPGPNPPREDTILADDGSSGGNFTGNYRDGYEGVYQQMRWNFSFLSEDDGPDAMTMYFFSGADGNLWYLNLTPPASVGDWTSYSVDLSYAEGWRYGLAQGTAQDFSDAIADIDWVGIYLLTPAGGELNYGLDDFEFETDYLVPEPGSFYMLGAAFLSMGVAFRRRLRDLVDGRGKKSA